MSFLGYALDADGIQSLLGVAVVSGALVGSLFVLLTLFYGRSRS